MGQNKVKLVFAEDHNIVRESFVSFLTLHHGDRFEIVAEAQNGYSALMHCLSKKPDILVLDWMLGGGLEGYGLLRLLKEYVIPVRVVVLTGTDRYKNPNKGRYEPDLYLLKGISMAQFVVALEEVIAQTKELKISNTRLKLPEVRMLSVREKQILSLVGEGKTDRQIALKLGITEGTVGQNLRNIYNKLNVSTRGEALVVAYLSGLLAETENVINDATKTDYMY